MKKALLAGIPVIVVLVLLGLFLPGLWPSRERSWRGDRYLCRWCGAERVVLVWKRSGVTRKRVDEVRPTTLSKQIAEATGTDCEHDWVWISFAEDFTRRGARGRGDGGAGSGRWAFRLAEAEGASAGLVRFAQDSGQSPREVWSTLLRYIVSEESWNAPLIDDMANEIITNGDAFDDWLWDNYERVVEELKNPTSKPADQDRESPPSDLF
jgi:hypothetical protein